MTSISRISIVAVAFLALAACNRGSDAADPNAAARAAQRLAALPAPYNQADLANGRQTFQLCSACHTIVEGGADMTGPNLHGVFGRRAASVASYKYSPALQNTSWVWTPELLDKWLASPQTTLPGTKMSFVGIKDAKARIDVIGYLMMETSSGAN